MSGAVPPAAVHYRLTASAAGKRATAAATIGAVTTLAPVLLGLELLPRLGATPGGTFWTVMAAVVALIGTRTYVQHGSVRRRLLGMRIIIDDLAIMTETPRASLTIPRARVARIVEIDGALGGVRVESLPDAHTGETLVASVPRGGDGFGDARAALERWRPIERRRRPGLGVRLLFGAAIVAAVFFLPFVLDDLVAKSKLVAFALVVVAWGVTRWTMRTR